VVVGLVSFPSFLVLGWLFPRLRGQFMRRGVLLVEHASPGRGANGLGGVKGNIGGTSKFSQDGVGESFLEVWLSLLDTSMPKTFSLPKSCQKKIQTGT